MELVRDGSEYYDDDSRNNDRSNGVKHKVS